MGGNGVSPGGGRYPVRMRIRGGGKVNRAVHRWRLLRGHRPPKAAAALTPKGVSLHRTSHMLTHSPRPLRQSPGPAAPHPRVHLALQLEVQRLLKYAPLGPGATGYENIRVWVVLSPIFDPPAQKSEISTKKCPLPIRQNFVRNCE